MYMTYVRRFSLSIAPGISAKTYKALPLLILSDKLLHVYNVNSAPLELVTLSSRQTEQPYMAALGTRFSSTKMRVEAMEEGGSATGREEGNKIHSHTYPSLIDSFIAH